MAVSIEQTLATLRLRAAKARADQEAGAAALRAKLFATMPRHLDADVRAWLIGSLAWGGFGERSDIDVVVSGITSSSACRLEMALMRELVAEVEVLRFEELPQSFRDRVEREGIPLHGK